MQRLLAAQIEYLVELYRRESRLAGGVGLTGSSGAGAAGSGCSVVIHFVFNKAQDKQNASFEHPFTTRPTIQHMCEVLENKYPELLRIKYMLKSGTTDITEETWVALDLVPKKKSKRFTVAVVLMYKAFSAISTDEGLGLLGVTGTIAAPDSLAATAAFTADPLNGSDKLPEEITKRTRWTTVDCVLQHLANDLACRGFVSRTHETAKEQGKRELVAPFLMAAAAIVAEVQVHAEFNVDGTSAHGCVDWVMLYQAFCIVVVEAKLNVPFLEYLGQLAAEMLSAREQFAMTALGKRKAEAASALPEVPSYGILTNGHYMQIFKYYTREDKKVLLQSELFTVPISSVTTYDEALKAARPIVEKLVHILRAQIQEYEKCPEAKRQRT